MQVEVKSNKAPTRYFKVDETKADEFCANYKKRDKKDTRTSNLILIGSVLAGTLVSAPLTNKINSFMLRMFVGAIPCVGLAILANALSIPKLAAKHEQFVKNNGVLENDLIINTRNNFCTRINSYFEF